MWHALISPRLALRETSVASLGADSYRVRLVLENTGWLPTYVTKKALEKKLSRPVIAEIKLPAGAKLQAGREREELGQLEGRAYKPVNPEETEESTTDRVKVEWVVKAKKGAKVKVVVRHDRGGVVRAEVILK